MAGQNPGGLITIGGLPAHPLLVHAVVVLLPLAALCAVALALLPRWRRKYGWPVLLLTAVAVGVVPISETAGQQLLSKLTMLDSPLIQRHTDLGEELLPFSLGFGVAVILLLVAGRLADREHAAQAAAQQPAPAEGSDPAEVGPTVPKLWRRVAMLASVLVVATALATTVQVVRVGDSGARAVWQGVGS
jgi:hypothetical protein